MKSLEFLKKYQLEKKDLKIIHGGTEDPEPEPDRSYRYCPTQYVEVWCNYQFVGCFVAPLLHPPC